MVLGQLLNISNVGPHLEHLLLMAVQTPLIADIFASNLSNLLNTHSPEPHNAMLASIKSKLSVNEISGVFVSEDEVCEALSSLKTNQIALVFFHSF